MDGNTYSAKVVGKDPYSDLAVLQLTDNFSDERVIPLIFANSSQLQVGQQAIAIGKFYAQSIDCTLRFIVVDPISINPHPDYLPEHF